ncbi:MAG TPA: hypothetical protein VNO32_04385, partial [Candidatus Acidoferrum sp.]|nr:hypothetical protein [Candidatus Acidoferrum sp.]
PLGRSSLWQFETSPYRAVSRGQPSSLAQHDAIHVFLTHLLRMPFGFHLTMDTLPSGVQQAVASGRSWLNPAFAFVPG